MTQLRQKMLEELQGRHYSYRTANTYIRIVRDFAAYFHRPPDKMGPEHIRQYQAYLFQSKKLSTASVSQYVSALRFLYVKTLRRHFLTEHIPFPKSPRQLSPSGCRQCLSFRSDRRHIAVLAARRACPFSSPQTERRSHSPHRSTLLRVPGSH